MNTDIKAKVIIIDVNKTVTVNMVYNVNYTKSKSWLLHRNTVSRSVSCPLFWGLVISMCQKKKAPNFERHTETITSKKPHCFNKLYTPKFTSKLPQLIGSQQCLACYVWQREWSTQEFFRILNRHGCFGHFKYLCWQVCLNSFTDTRDVAATWFDLWDRNIFLDQPVHFNLQVSVELRGTETGSIEFQSGLYIKSSNSMSPMYQVSAITYQK